jgi:hypothetical protein
VELAAALGFFFFTIARSGKNWKAVVAAQQLRKGEEEERRRDVMTNEGED